MKHPRAHRVIPALCMSAAAAVPVVTTAELVTHVSSSKQVPTLAQLQPIATSRPLKNALPAATATPVRRSAVPKSTSAPRPTATSVPTTRTYTGAVVYDQYGAVQATITVTGRKITAVSISAPMDDPRSAGINQQAVPLLQSETLTAQSAAIDGVSGATETTQAYVQSLQSALDRARL
jgi:uncharacterized protein with FMN-binding domain